jgi:hypothetical protein
MTRRTPAFVKNVTETAKQAAQVIKAAKKAGRRVIPPESGFAAADFDFGFNRPTRTEKRKIEAAKKLPKVQALKNKRSFGIEELPIRYRNNVRGLVNEIEKNPYKLDALLKPNEYITMNIQGSDKEGKKFTYKSAKVFGNFTQLAKFLAQYETDKFGHRKSRGSQKKLIDSLSFIKFDQDPVIRQIEAGTESLRRSQAKFAANQKRKAREAADRIRTEKRLVNSEERLANVNRRSIVGQLRTEAIKSQLKEAKQRERARAKTQKILEKAQAERAKLSERRASAASKRASAAERKLAEAMKQVAELRKQLSRQGRKSGGRKK